MKKLEKVIGFAAALSAASNTAKEESISSEDIVSLMNIDSDFRGVICHLRKLLLLEDKTKPVSEKSEEKEVNVHVSISHTNEGSDNSKEWKIHPSKPNIRVSKDGDAQIRKDGKWIDGHISFRQGCYKTLYDPATRTEWPLARLMLETFVGERNKSYSPIYMDRDKSNCKLENLRWGLRNAGGWKVLPSDIEKMCKYILDHIGETDSALIEGLIRAKIIDSPQPFKTMKKGGYSEISDKYLHVTSNGEFKRVGIVDDPNSYI